MFTVDVKQQYNNTTTVFATRWRGEGEGGGGGQWGRVDYEDEIHDSFVFRMAFLCGGKRGKKLLFESFPAFLYFALMFASSYKLSLTHS